ncbi:hypothetical protein [Paractinoplanes atraurantiacus]|uniref:Uncharacterized protein n=1 Tax=Paractinoplanes atraurantiacus TaxID=1036182 RepID=A0A285KCW3_9ACTN|nr:hypothetical protein [Actinoplanes atraurantiacus]SNY70450.1 hypothetical protein SAMN05421748_13787 [Actinoplanes atraurantiacus]
MLPILGTWDVDLKTPIGTLHAVYVFTETEGAVTGTRRLIPQDC